MYSESHLARSKKYLVRHLDSKHPTNFCLQPSKTICQVDRPQRDPTTTVPFLMVAFPISRSAAKSQDFSTQGARQGCRFLRALKQPYHTMHIVLQRLYSRPAKHCIRGAILLRSIKHIGLAFAASMLGKALNRSRLFINGTSLLAALSAAFENYQPRRETERDR